MKPVLIFIVIIFIITILIIIATKHSNDSVQHSSLPVLDNNKTTIWEELKPPECKLYTFFKKNINGEYIAPLEKLSQIENCDNVSCYIKTSNVSCIDPDQLYTGLSTRKCVSDSMKCRTSSNIIIEKDSSNDYYKICTENTCSGILAAVVVETKNNIDYCLKSSGYSLTIEECNVYDVDQRFKIYTFDNKLNSSPSGAIISIHKRGLTNDMTEKYVDIDETNKLVLKDYNSSSRDKIWFRASEVNMTETYVSGNIQRCKLDSKTINNGDMMLLSNPSGCGDLYVPTTVYIAINQNPGKISSKNPDFTKGNPTIDGTVVWEARDAGWNSVTFQADYFKDIPDINKSISINLTDDILSNSPPQLVYLSEDDYIKYKDYLKPNFIKNIYLDFPGVNFKSVQVSSNNIILANFVPYKSVISSEGTIKFLTYVNTELINY